MEKLAVQDLQKKAYEIRLEIINMLTCAASGHSAGSLGLTELFTTLYFHILNHDPKNPAWEDRDRFFLSCGHVAPALYATMAHAGYFPKTRLASLRKLNSPLQGHPERTRLPGLESTSGPLGSGLAQAAGYALAAKLDQKRFRIYCLTSDGEHQEGNHWEAVLFAAKYALSNLTAFVDRNFIQISGNTEDIMPLEPLAEKYHSFGWHTLQINGHDPQAIITSVEQSRRIDDRPTMIITHTTPGKGVSFMENKASWHGKPPNKKEAEIATKELKQVLRELAKEND